MKFIDNFDDIKINYLYLIKDKFNYYYSICAKESNEYSLKIFSFDIIKTAEDYNYGYCQFTLQPCSVSPIETTHPDYDNITYSVYEIGHINDHPEYLL